MDVETKDQKVDIPRVTVFGAGLGFEPRPDCCLRTPQDSRIPVQESSHVATLSKGDDPPF